MNKYVVTGGEGFIGSYIVGKTNSISYDIKSGFDIRNKTQFSDICSDISGVYHCAGRISVPESFQKEDEYFDHNVTGTSIVCECARKTGARVVFSSSASVYGELDHCADESEDLSPQSPYAAQKMLGERQVLESNDNVVLRYFNVYGPGQSAAYAGVITLFITKALHNQDIVICGDGNQVRDFIYVDDVADANILAMHKEISSADPHIFNIGSGTQTRITDLANMIIEITQSHSKILYDQARQGDIYFSCANIDRARTILGFNPKTTLREGLEKTIAYYKNLI